MTKYILIVMLLLVKNCDCNYNGKRSFVNWNKKNSSFENITINLGEFYINPQIENCYCKGKNIFLEGKLENIDTLTNSKKSFNNKVIIIELDNDNKILDTLFVTKKDGAFNLNLEKNKANSIIFKLENEDFGVKFNISDF
jgi:hypothetical protein